MRACWFISYRLVSGASEAEFLQAAEKCCTEVASKKKGFISWQQLKDGDTWVDFMTFENMEDAVAFEKESDPTNPYAAKFYSFIDFKSLTSKKYLVERSYK